ncbi:MAG: hypothetical protein J0H65_11235 [Rhizobiales bacterium]|nr:hypothetical protein [Hyphomicrobiales bacterium]
MVDVAAPPRAQVTSFVDWGAIIAGAIAASAISFVLLTAGASIGLSLLSAEPSQSYGKLAASLSAFWMVFVPILSLLIGGYIAGRMRQALENATEEEVSFRDGIQGLLVWAVSVVIGGVLAFLTAASAAQLSAGVAKTALEDRGMIVATAVDNLLRPPAAAPQVTEAPAAATPSPPNPAAQDHAGVTTDSRNALARALTASVADGQLSAEDRLYLARVVATQTGLPQAEAEKRVDEVYVKALSAAETARKAVVAAGLVTVTALLLGLAAAWYAAQRGGQHRDQNIPAKLGWSRPLTRRPSDGP